MLCADATLLPYPCTAADFDDMVKQVRWPWKKTSESTSLCFAADFLTQPTPITWCERTLWVQGGLC